MKEELVQILSTVELGKQALKLMICKKSLINELEPDILESELNGP